MFSIWQLASDVEAIKSVCFSSLKVSNAKTFLGMMAQLPGFLLCQDQAQSKSMTVGQLDESFDWALGLSLREAWTSIFLWSFPHLLVATWIWTLTSWKLSPNPLHCLFQLSETGFLGQDGAQLPGSKGKKDKEWHFDISIYSRKSRRLKGKEIAMQRLSLKIRNHIAKRVKLNSHRVIMQNRAQGSQKNVRHLFL